MDQEPQAVRVSSDRARLPSSLVVIVAVLLLVAMLKPWANGPADSTAGGPVAVATAAGGASPSPAPTTWMWDPNAMACMSATGERVLTLVRWPGHEVRTWQVGAPALAAEPLDPEVTPLRIESSHVVGIGVCGLRPDPASPIPAAGELLAVGRVVTGAGGPILVDLGTGAPITQDRTHPDLGVLYAPPPSDATRHYPGPGLRITLPSGSPAAAAGGTIPWSPDPALRSPLGSPSETWPIGSYALEFHFASDPAGTVLWLRIEIVAAAGEP